MGEAQLSDDGAWRRDLETIMSMLRVFRDELPEHVATDTDEDHVRRFLTACRDDGSLVYVILYDLPNNR